MTRWIKIAIAVVVVGALLGVYFWITNREDTSQAETEERPVVLELPEESIERIVLEGPGREVTLRRTDEEWEPEYPYDVAFRSRAIDRVVGSASRLTASRIIEEQPSDLGQYGLGDDAARAAIELSTGETRYLYIGDRSPSGSGYYVRSEGSDTVYLVSTYNAEPLIYEIADLRDKSLPSIDRKKLNRVTIAGGNDTIRIVPIEEGEDDVLSDFSRLKIVEPYIRAYPVSADGLQTLTEELPQFSVSRFIEDRPDDLAQYGLASPRGELELGDQDDNTLHLLFGSEAPEGGVYAKEAEKPGVFTVDASLDFLSFKPFELVDKFVLIVNIKNVDRFRVIAGGETYEGRMERTEVPAEEEGEEPSVETTYYFQGSEIEEDAFKGFYQEVIGLTVDSERPDPVRGEPDPGDIAISFRFEVSDLPRERLRADLVPYDENFYAVFRRGVSEFLISRLQVQQMLDAAENLTGGETAS